MAELQAQLAKLQAERDAEKATAEKATAEAAQKLEAERQAKLSDAQKLQEQLDKQRAELDTTRQQLVADRRTLALDRLGVADKFKGFAPQVDPADPKGAKTLEDWAKANPELLRPQHQQVTPANLALEALKSKAGTALQQVLSGARKSTLVTARNLSQLK